MIRTLLATFRRRRQERLAIEALACLSDHQLNDIGLNRASIVQAIRLGTRP